MDLINEKTLLLPQEGNGTAGEPLPVSQGAGRLTRSGGGNTRRKDSAQCPKKNSAEKVDVAGDRESPVLPGTGTRTRSASLASIISDCSVDLGPRVSGWDSTQSLITAVVSSPPPGSKRRSEEEQYMSAYSGSDEEVAMHSRSASSLSKRGRGRPPTTGQYVGLAKAKNDFVEAKRRELELEYEIETTELARRLREQRRTTAKQVAVCADESESAETIGRQVRDDVAMILTVAKNSGNLKGTYQKSLKEVAASIELNFDKIRSRTINEETEALQSSNRALSAKVKELEEKLIVLETTIEHMNQQRITPFAADHDAQDPELFMDTSPSLRTQPRSLSRGVEEEGVGHRRPHRPPPSRPPPPSQPVVDQELMRAIMTQVGTMVSARLESLVGRLPPEERLRPSLAADAKNKKKASYSSVVKTATKPSSDTTEGQGKKEKKKETRPATSDTTPETSKEGWETAGGGRKAKNKNKKKAASKPPPDKKTAEKKKKKRKRKRKLRTPRAPAVVITLQEAAEKKGVTYADVLRKARQNVLPAELGIEQIRFRQAMTGARILQLPDTASAEQADNLADKLRGVLGEAVKVSRPAKRASLRISGLDDSVTSADVVTEVAKSGNCTADSIKIGEVRQGPGGMGSVWVQCPATAAQTLTDAGRLLVGWSSAAVRLLEPRPMKCYRCLEVGHTRSRCVAQVDRSELCYRCGKTGHKLASCSAAPHCPVCAEAKRPANHHVGSKACSPPRKKQRRATKAPIAAGAEQAPMDIVDNPDG